MRQAFCLILVSLVLACGRFGKDGGAVVVGPTPTPTPDPTANALIFYVTDRSIPPSPDGYKIVKRALATNMESVVFSSGADRVLSIVVRPDGTKIYFTRLGSTSDMTSPLYPGNISELDLTSSQSRIVHFGQWRSEELNISPDGTALVYETIVSYFLQRVLLADDTVDTLYNGAATVPRYSASGDTISFIDSNNQFTQIDAVTKATLSSVPATAINSALPFNGRLYYIKGGNIGEEMNIHSMLPDGSDDQAVTSDPVGVSNYSPTFANTSIVLAN